LCRGKIPFDFSNPGWKITSELSHCSEIDEVKLATDKKLGVGQALLKSRFDIRAVSLLELPPAVLALVIPRAISS